MESPNTQSFDNNYENNDFYFGSVASEELEEFCDKGVVAQNALALDLGCGEGRDSLMLARKGYSLVSIDKSQEGVNKLIQAAFAEGLNIDARCQDVESYNFPIEKYDLIVSVTLLDHLTKDRIGKIIEMMKMALKRNGVIFIEVFTVDDPGFQDVNRRNASECASFIMHYFEHGELIAYFKDYKIIRYEEKLEVDESHGPTHEHGVAILLARKEID